MDYTSTWFVAIGSLCIILPGSMVYYMNRHRFPLADRGWLTVAGAVPLTLLSLGYLIDKNQTNDQPCSMIQNAQTVIVIPLSILGFTLRALLVSLTTHNTYRFSRLLVTIHSNLFLSSLFFDIVVVSFRDHR
jgi:hypothetical protein